MRVELPGGHAELADIKILTPDNQDDYHDLREGIRAKREEAVLAAAAAANPAAMPDPLAEPPTVRLTRRDIKPIHDLVCGWVVRDISWPGILPWDPGSRDRLAAAAGLGAWNALLGALEPYFGILNGEVPKENEPSTTISASTSSAAAPAPPAVSAPAPSATPAG